MTACDMDMPTSLFMFYSVWLALGACQHTSRGTVRDLVTTMALATVTTYVGVLIDRDRIEIERCFVYSNNVIRTKRQLNHTSREGRLVEDGQH